MNQNEVYQLISSITGQKNILTVPREFINYTGDIVSALLLNQLLYWTPKTSDGWIYKTYQDWEDEISFSKYKVNKAAKILKELDIIETIVKKAENSPTVHYRLNTEKFIESFLNFLNERDFTFKSKKALLTNITETTTEITTKEDNNVIPGLKSEETLIHEIIDCWNDKNLGSHHSYAPSLVKNIRTVFYNHYTPVDIHRAINNYSIIYHNDKYNLPIKMTLHNFFWWPINDNFQTKKGFIQFLDDYEPLKKFIKYKDPFLLLRSQFQPVTVQYDPSKLLDKENNAYYGIDTDELRDVVMVNIDIYDIRENGIHNKFNLNTLEYVIAALFFNRKHTPELETLKEMMDLWKENKDKFK